MLTVLQASPSTLQVVWFLLVAVLWIGYFFLEGFDYGVAMLIPVLGKDDEKARRVIINTIGPIVGRQRGVADHRGRRDVRRLPGLVRHLVLGLYLPLFLVLVGLILRGVAFEYRAKRDDLKWKRAFDFAASFGSLLPALVFGIGFANFVKGLRTGPDLLMAQGFWSLFNPFALLGGVLFVALFLTHGAVFLALKTRGEIHDKARVFAIQQRRGHPRADGGVRARAEHRLPAERHPPGSTHRPSPGSPGCSRSSVSRRPGGSPGPSATAGRSPRPAWRC